MNKGWLIQSEGLPYFGFFQNDLDGMQGAGSVGSGGEFSLQIDVAFDAAPVQASSVDEEHPLISFYEWPAGPPADLLTLGVTPSGRLYARSPSGGFVQTVAGFIVFNGARYSLRMDFTAGSGILSAGADGVGSASTTATAAQPQPSASRLGRFGVLCGANGITRVPCRVYQAAYTDENSGITWDLSDAGGIVLGSRHDTNDYPINADLTAAYMIPWAGYTRAWGESVPATPVSHAFRWRPNTEWQRVQRTKTAWARV